MVFHKNHKGSPQNLSGGHLKGATATTKASNHGARAVEFKCDPAKGPHEGHSKDGGFTSKWALNFLLCCCLVSPVPFFTPHRLQHARQASLSSTISQSLLKLKPIELVTPSNHLILCRPLLPPSVFPSIRVFSNELALPIRWPKDWSFSFVSPSSEYSGLISFRIDCFDLALQNFLLGRG